MFTSEEIVVKQIITNEGEKEFQVRFISDENTGILVSKTEKSYFILDSMDYWYDLIQEKYPPKRKCKCKKDFFNVFFEYTPRVGTDDYRTVDIVLCCTNCSKRKNIATIDIDYSPTQQLFDYPITFCERPKIKYKTFSICKNLKQKDHNALLEYLSSQELLIYLYYFENTKGKRCMDLVSKEQLFDLVFVKKVKYFYVFFSTTAFDEIISNSLFDTNGIYIDWDIWRHNEIVGLSSPILFMGKELYQIKFCSEYIENGKVKQKSIKFSNIVNNLSEYCKKL